MKAKDVVTVIMNVFNVRQDWLKASIDSIAPQVKELIISACEVDTNTEWFKTNLPANARVVYLPRTEQIGKCPQQSFRQINNAIPFVATPYVCWASSDDLMNDDKYQLELDCLVKNGKKVCYSDYEMVDEHLQRIKVVSLGDYRYDRHLTGNFVSDLALMETDLLKRYGLLGDKYRNYAYWDMWLRIFKGEGNVFVNNPVPTWKYRQDSDSTHILRRKSPAMQMEANNDRRYMLKQHGVSYVPD